MPPVSARYRTKLDQNFWDAALEAAGSVALPFLKNLSNHPNKDVRLSAAHLRVSIGWSAAPSPAESPELAIADEGALVWAFVFGKQFDARGTREVPETFST